MEVERSIWLRKKTNELQVHPYKPVSWLPTHQRISSDEWATHPLMSGQPRNRLVRMNL